MGFMGLPPPNSQSSLLLDCPVFGGSPTLMYEGYPHSLLSPTREKDSSPECPLGQTDPQDFRCHPTRP